MSESPIKVEIPSPSQPCQQLLSAGACQQQGQLHHAYQRHEYHHHHHHHLIVTPNHHTVTQHPSAAQWDCATAGNQVKLFIKQILPDLNLSILNYGLGF